MVANKSVAEMVESMSCDGVGDWQVATHFISAISTYMRLSVESLKWPVSQQLRVVHKLVSWEQ